MSQTNGSNIGDQVGSLINEANQRTIGPAGVGSNLVLWSSVSVRLADSVSHCAHLFS